MTSPATQSVALPNPSVDGAGNEPMPISLILCALAIGLLLGILARDPGQRGVDGSLVLAGIINYPPQSPMSAYFLDSWTTIHQIGALLLRAGLKQAHLSELFFLFPSALLFCTYAMIIYGFSNRFLFGLLGALLCYLANPLAWFFTSPDYPTLGLLWSQPSEHTFGFWAQVGAVWVIGCVAAGRYALAGFSALVLIAVHPVLGVYMTALLIGTIVIGRAFSRLEIHGFAKGAAWGAAITILSLAAYFKTRSGFSAVIDQTAYDAYMRVWDLHRDQPMTLADAIRIGVSGALAIAALSAFNLLDRPRRYAAILASSLIMLAVIVSTIAYYAVHLVPNFLPGLVVRAMPGRLLDVQAYISTPMALALALCVASRWAKFWATSATVRIVRILPAAILLLVIISALEYALPRQRLIIQYARTFLQTKILGYISPVQQESELFWRGVRHAGVNGLVLTSPAASEPSIYLGHLPIALYGAIDFVPYLPQTVGEVAQIVWEGYGISFTDPPRQMWHHGGLPPDAGRTYWAQLASDDRCRISRDLGVVALVAPSDWSITLPVLVQGAQFTLYAISCSK